MTQRNPWAVLGLSIITIGIYYIYWLVQTKKDMVNQGADIPTAWMIIIPLVNIYWLWKFSQGIGHVTKQKTDPLVAFLVLFLIDFIGGAIMQYEINTKASAK